MVVGLTKATSMPLPPIGYILLVRSKVGLIFCFLKLARMSGTENCPLGHNR